MNKEIEETIDLLNKAIKGLNFDTAIKLAKLLQELLKANKLINEEVFYEPNT